MLFMQLSMWSASLCCVAAGEEQVPGRSCRCTVGHVCVVRCTMSAVDVICSGTAGMDAVLGA